MQDLESRDLKRLAAWFSDRSDLWVPPAAPVTGGRRILALFRAIFRMYGDLHWQVKDVHGIGEGRFVYFSDSWGTIGAGTRYRNQVATVVRFDEEGRIATLSDYFKDTAIFRKGRKVS